MRNASIIPLQQFVMNYRSVQQVWWDHSFNVHAVLVSHQLSMKVSINFPWVICIRISYLCISHLQWHKQVDAYYYKHCRLRMKHEWRTHRPLSQGHIQPGQTQLYTFEVRKFNLEIGLKPICKIFVAIVSVSHGIVLPTVHHGHYGC